MIRQAVLSLAMVVLSALPALAAPFSNGNFATPTVNHPADFENITNGGTIGAWKVTGQIDLIGINYWAPYLGNGQSVDLDGLDETGAISQTFDTIIGNLYSVTFAQSANRDDNSIVAKTLTATINDGSNDIFSDVFSSLANGQGVSMTQSGDSLWRLNTFNFIATSASTTLTFSSNSNAGSSWGPVVAAVTLNDLGAQEVPEPASMAVWGLVTAVGSVFAYRRRYRKSA